MKKSDFKVGQTVFLKIIAGSNVVRYINPKNIEDHMMEATVKNIGRKYITVDPLKGCEVKFNMAEDFRQFYEYGGRDYDLFLSKQDILDDIESEKIYKILRNELSSYRNDREFSLEQLKAVYTILEIDKED